MKKSQQPDLVIHRLGNHLFRVDRKDGSSFLKWDWDKLQEDVNKAMINYQLDQVLTEVKKLDVVAETEKKVRKTRKKKVAE